jgi:hypothetical protein
MMPSSVHAVLAHAAGPSARRTTSAWERGACNGAGKPATTPCAWWEIGDSAPCMTIGARTTVPPSAAPMA